MSNEIWPCWWRGVFPTGRKIRSAATKWSTHYPTPPAPPAFAVANEICAHYWWLQWRSRQHTSTYGGGAPTAPPPDAVTPLLVGCQLAPLCSEVTLTLKPVDGGAGRERIKASTRHPPTFLPHHFWKTSETLAFNSN